METTIDVTVCQINTKRHWPRPASRMLKMLKTAEREGATIITLNEISWEQANAIKALPGWDIHWEVNDHLKGGGWVGNAIAWKVSEWTCQRSWGQPTTIDYRAGRLLQGRFGPWFQRVITQACVRLQNTSSRFCLVIQAFHYPTAFNSNEKSRERAANRTAGFVSARIKRGVAVILGGDGNNIFAKTKGLRMMVREGPDAIQSTGKLLSSVILPFKRRLLSDHNGALAKIRFVY